jgi:NAD(P)-dependent dehydrogenase (short-subunit alcohol dehydrogenase family)
VVTGGASGIGRAVVVRLLAERWRVAVFDLADAPASDLSTEDGPVSDLSTEHGPVSDLSGAQWHRVDVRDEDAVDRALDGVEQTLGPPALLVHSAAIAPAAAPCLELSVREFREVLDVDLLGAFVTARAAAVRMRRAGGGSMVLVSSAAGLRARPGLAAYGAAKAGVIQLAKVLAVELAEHGIRVNCVSPGVTLTPLMLRSWGTADPAEAFRRADAQAPIPLGRLVTAEEVADAILYLGTGSGAVTGHNLVVDGGRSV